MKTLMLILAGLAALFLGTVLLINTDWFDEDLLPEVQALLDQPAKPYSANNALPALMAFERSSVNPLQEDTAVIREFLNQKIADSGQDFLSYDEYDELVGEAGVIEWPEAYQRCDARKNITCFSTMYAQMLNQPISAAEFEQVFKRYDALITMSEFEDMTQFNLDASLPGLQSVLVVKRIYLAHLLANQPSDAFIRLTTQDIKFWRMVLSNSRLLITKMVAVASLRINLAFLSTALKTDVIQHDEFVFTLKSIDPLTDAESAVVQTFETEFKQGIEMFSELHQRDDSSFSEIDFFYQPNATINLHYQSMVVPLQKIWDLNSAEFYNAIKNNQYVGTGKELSAWRISNLYNPVGKKLVGYAIPNFTDYVARVHDLKGMIHLLNLQIELAEHPDRSSQEIISQSQWVNPYTMEPMSYDAELKRIHFDCMDSSSECELYF